MNGTTLLLSLRGQDPGHPPRPSRRARRPAAEARPSRDQVAATKIADQVPCVSENPLSEREREVVRALVFGVRATEAARLLGITKKTVETHRNNIYRKLDIHSYRELMGQALRLGIV